jgi:hypothetical protein
MGVYTCIGLKKTEFGLKETSISVKFQKIERNTYQGKIVPLNTVNDLSYDLQKEIIDESFDEFIQIIPIVQVKIKADFPITYGSDLFLECYNVFEFGKISFSYLFIVLLKF